MVDLYFGGAEVVGWRSLLAQERVEHVALSFMGIRRRSKMTKPYLLEDKFADEQKIFLDSGAYTINNAEDKYTLGDLHDLAGSYMAFVAQNLDRIEMASEFDARVLGEEWLEAQREDFWDELPREKFLPIWHAEKGLSELERLAEKYARVGIPNTALDGRNLTPVLNSLVQKYGTKLHGIAMTKPTEMAEIRWDSVASTSWLSPSQYGDTIVWVNNELKRYPKKYKEQARKRHRTLFEKHGFDSEKIEADDTTEVLRLTIWSWQQLVASLDRHRPSADVATTPAISSDGPIAETLSAPVDTHPAETRNSGATLVPRSEDERTNLPVIGFEVTKETFTGDDGVQRQRDVLVPKTHAQSMRQCNSCFLAAKCPAYRANADCAYDIPVEIRTRDQYRALMDHLVEWQFQRVAFMKMAEDMEGGYADPNLSGEMDRLSKMIERKNEMEAEGFSIKVEAKGKGEAGVLSRLFGRDAAEQNMMLERPVDSTRAIANIIDADVIEVD